MLTRTIAQARAQPTSLHIVLLLSLCAPLLKLAGPQRTIVGASGVVDLVNFVLPGDATSKSHSGVKKRYSLFTDAWGFDPLRGFAPQC